MLAHDRPAPHKRDVSRSSRALGAGCDGRLNARRRSALKRTAKSCGPDLPTLGSSFAGWRCRPWRARHAAQGDGGYQARTPGRARISRSTIVQGVPDCFGVPVVTNSCAFYPCTRGCGCGRSTGIPCALLFRGTRRCITRAQTVPREYKAVATVIAAHPSRRARCALLRMRSEQVARTLTPMVRSTAMPSVSNHEAPEMRCLKN
jgi:hypothetical protein